MLRSTRRTLAIAVAILAVAPAAAHAASDLSVSVTPSVGSVRVGETVDLTFALTNHGPSAVAQPRLDGLWDVAALAFQQVVATRGAISGTVFGTGSVFFIGPATMAAGETDSVTLRMQALTAGTAMAAAQLGSPSADANPGNDVGRAGVALTGTPPAGGGSPSRPVPAVTPFGGSRPRSKLALEAKRRLQLRAGRRLTLRFRAGAAGQVTLAVLKGHRRVGRVAKRARKGHNQIAWRARRHGHALRRGRYTYRLTLRSGRRTAVVRGTLRLR